VRADSPNFSEFDGFVFWTSGAKGFSIRTLQKEMTRGMVVAASAS
jgi:hypothetical protein